MRKAERRWMWKRALSMLLVCVMLFTSVDLTALAEEPEVGTEDLTISGAGIETVSGDETETMVPGEDDGAQAGSEVNADPSMKVEQEMFSFEAKNDIGSLFVDEMQEAVQNEQASMVEEYAITDIQVSGATAVVMFHAATDCSVVISVYEEGSQKPYAFGNALIAANSGKAEVLIETDQMPEYFEIKAYLVETDSLRPLSKEFHSRLYTREIQFMENLTVNDFDPETVVNLDEDETTNFLVFRKETILVKETADTNILTGYDKIANTYSFINADEKIKGLKEGDIFVYYDAEEQLRVIRVQSVYTESTEVQSSISGTPESDEQISDEESAETQTPDEEDTGDQAADEEGAETQTPDEEDTGDQAADEEGAETQTPDEEDTGERPSDEEKTEEEIADEEELGGQIPEEGVETPSQNTTVLNRQIANEEFKSQYAVGESVWQLTVDEKIADIQDADDEAAEEQENEIVSGEQGSGDGLSDDSESKEQEADEQDIQKSNVGTAKAQAASEENTEDYLGLITTIEAANIENSEYLGEIIEDKSDFLKKFCGVIKIEEKISNTKIPQAIVGIVGGTVEAKVGDVETSASVLYNGRDKADGEDYEYDNWNVSLEREINNKKVSIETDVSFAFEADINFYYYNPLLPLLFVEPSLALLTEIDYATCSLMLDTKLSGEISVGMEVEIPLTAGPEIESKYVEFAYKPKVVIGGKATLSVQGFRAKENYTLVVGPTAPVEPDLYKGERIVDGPSDCKLEATLYIGVRFEPDFKLGIKFADDQGDDNEKEGGSEEERDKAEGDEDEGSMIIFEIGLSIEAKINLNVSWDSVGGSHDACQGKCVAIELVLDTPYDLTLKLFGHNLVESVLKKWFPKLGEEIPPTPLFEAYYCQVHGGFKRGECPYIGSNVSSIKVEVHDTNGKAVEGAIVKCALGDSQTPTDSKGRTELIIHQGKQNIYIEKDGITYSQAVRIPDDVEDDGGVLNITINPTRPLADSTAVKDVYIANYYYKTANGVCYAAITTDGSLYMWGGNPAGQLGDGTTEPRYEPIKVPLDDVEKFQFSPDGLTCAAITKEKELYIWGDNSKHIVGVNALTEHQIIPFHVLQGEKIEKFIFSSDNTNSAAITTDGKLYIWGNNLFSQIKSGGSGLILEPVLVMEHIAEFVCENYTCVALSTDSKLYLWGKNTDGIAGDDVENNSMVPPPEKYFLPGVEQFSVSSNFLGDRIVGSAIGKNGNLVMWGSGYSEAFYVPGEEDVEERVWVVYKVISTEGSKVKQNYVDASEGEAAAVTEDGKLYMWKDLSDSEGDYKTDETTILTFEKFKNEDVNVEQFYMNNHTYAAITKDHKLYMWGSNRGYQLGNGTKESIVKPSVVLEDKEVLYFEMLYGGLLSVALVKNEASKDLYMWGSYSGSGSSSGGSFNSLSCDTKPQLKLSDVDRIVPYPDTPAAGAGTIKSSATNLAAIKSDGGLYEWMGSKEAEIRTGIKGVVDVSSVVHNVGTLSNEIYRHQRIGRGQDGNLYTWNGPAVKTEYLFGSQFIYPTNYSLMDITEEMSVQSSDMEEASISTYAEPSSQQTADFTNLLPNELYNVYAMKSREVESCLEPDNLLYIGQSTSDGDGNLHVSFEMKEAYASPAIFCVGFKRTDLAGAEVTIPDIVYDGNRHIPDVTVTYNGQVLRRGVDYRAYLDAYVEEIGEYELTVKGIGLYCGEKKVLFRVVAGATPGDPDDPTPDPIYGDVLPEDVPADGVIPEGLWIAGVAGAGYDYTGKVIKPEVRVYDHKTLLKEKTDYTIAYKNNTKAYCYTASDQEFAANKAPTITVTGKGNYTGKETQTFTIRPLDISVNAAASDGKGTEADSVQPKDNVFAADNMTIAANKKNQKPIPVLLWNDKKLKNNTDYTVTYYDSTGAAKLDYVREAGSYYIELVGKGNFTGTRRVNLTVTGQSDQLKLMNKMTVAKIPNQPYTGSEITPVLTVKDGKTGLKEGEHYTVSYSRNTEVGTAYAVVTGIEEKGYSGTKRVSFKITGGSVSKATVKGLTGQSFLYGGVNQEPELTVSVKTAGVEKTLQKGTDYKLTWQKNCDAGTATVTITGVGGYTGTLKKNFKIQAFDISANADGRFTAALAQEKVPYAKGGTKPEVSVTFLKDDGSTQKLKEGKDYTLSYRNHTTPNDGSRPDKLPTVTIKGKGNFKGTYSTKLTYQITTQDLGVDGIQIAAADKTYQNKKNVYTTKVTVTDRNGKALKAGTDYNKILAASYAYKNDTTLDNGTVRTAGTTVDKNDIIPAGTVLTVTVTGKGNYTGSITGEYRITQAAISSASITIPKQTYTGAAITLDKSQITVKVKGKPIAEDQYEIVAGSYKNNVKKGTASVTIRGVDNYGGTKTVKFTIKAKGFLWWWR